MTCQPSIVSMKAGNKKSVLFKSTHSSASPDAMARAHSSRFMPVSMRERSGAFIR